MADKSTLHSLKKFIMADRLGRIGRFQYQPEAQRQEDKEREPDKERKGSKKESAGEKGFSGNFFAGLRDYPSSSPASNAGSKVPASIGVYLALMIVAIIGLFLKNWISYSPAASLFISILIFIFFFVAIHYTPEAALKKTLVIITFVLDLFMQFLLGLFPESEFKSAAITYYVFAWIALSLVLFLMGVFDALGAGQRLPWWAWLLTAFLLGYLLIYILFPFLAQSPLLYQDKTHSDYFNIAKEYLLSTAKSIQETKNTAIDYMGCTFSATATPYQTCLENQRIKRYCNANFKTAAEQKDCTIKQKEILRQGERPGVAGSVSDAIEKVTEVTLKTDEYFPKETTNAQQSYPITLDVKNPREQAFTVRIDCVFKQAKQSIPGKISILGLETSEIQITETEKQVRLECQPAADLKGKYTLEFNAVLSGLQTFSFLKRAFISGEVDPALRKLIETDNFKSGERSSLGPEEFALLNFKFGTGSGTEPLVLVEEPVIFSFSVKDIGDGKVLKVNSYDFHGLFERGFSVDEERIGDADCLSGGEIMVIEDQTKKREPSELKRCFLNLPPDLKELAGNSFEVETFVAGMNYDYKITKSIPSLEVTPIEPVEAAPAELVEAVPAENPPTEAAS